MTPDDRRQLPLVALARSRPERTALLDEGGSWTYGDLLEASERVGRALGARLDGRDPTDRPIPFLVPPGREWAAVQWGIWRAGAMAVPLAVSHPPRELAWVLDDAGPPFVVAHPSLAARLRGVANERKLDVLSTDGLLAGAPDGADSLPGAAEDDGALMVYTSGTTGRPKGVVHTHGSLDAQARTLVEAWGWREDDRILLVLPLHHVHGIMNVVHCALRVGASCLAHPGFDAGAAWAEIASGALTVFMGVPTIYHRLVATWEDAPAEVAERWASGARGLRLMVSGSAALPAPLFHRWQEISGQRLLERYGMSETGMILSNPLEGPRIPGHVGRPLPGVEVRLVDEDGAVVWKEGEGPGVTGEVQVRGPGLFREYLDRPEVTREAFTERGWFRTGDVATLEEIPGDAAADRPGAPAASFRLLGRRSVDILKTGGYKVSALEIESVLLERTDVVECAVVGVPHPEWGEQVCAAVVGTGDLDVDGLRPWLKERLAPYKVPTRYFVVDALPRNAMGKVQKPEAVKLFEGGDQG